MRILNHSFMPMSGLMIGFDPFTSSPTMAPNAGGAPQQQYGQQQQQAQQPVSVPSSAVPGAPSGVASNQADNLNGYGSTQQATGGASPLENYSALFDNTQSNQQQQQATQQQQQQQQSDKQIKEALDLMKYGLNDYQAAAGRLNFMDGIDSSVVSAALGGDVESLQNMLNTFGRNIFAAATHSSGKLAGTAIKDNFEVFDGSLAEKFKSFSLSNVQQNIVNNDAPILNNPVLKPLLKQAMTLMAKAYPEASSEEITKHAVKYLQDTSSVINSSFANGGNQQQQQQQQQAGGRYSDLLSIG